MKMKIKTKLIISFCIIILVPICLITTSLLCFGRVQMRKIQQNYGVSNISTLHLANSVELLDHYTDPEFMDLVDLCQENPEELSEDTLEDWNTKLSDKFSYLILRQGDQIIYNGSVDNDNIISKLRAYGFLDSENQNTTYIESDENVLIKQVDFTDTEGQEASLFLVTSTLNLVPEVRGLVVELIIAVLVTLLVTAALLLGWVYRSLITPIQALQTAADYIKDGNLNFELKVNGEDEFSQLGVSFEEMRKRLKDNAEEKIANEKENRALISNIAHDLKTPITAVKGYAEGIMDGVANTPEKVDKYVRTIYNKANEMDTLINELTLYSKIDTNRIPYNFAQLNVKKYFEDCVEEIGLDLESKDINLSYYNYVEDDVEIIADPEQLRRVIHNIISNSAKYMNKTKKFISIRIQDVGDFIQVEMEDNGKGIAQRDIPYIFDRFYRTDSSRNSATGGSGIGLSIVKKIIEDHGGKIWATSKEDMGTTMYFVLRKYLGSQTEEPLEGEVISS